MATPQETWHQGYLTDLDYTKGYYRELEPGYLCYAALTAGVLPPGIEKGFSYCELGCGNGISLNLSAAAWPNAQFYGIDINPSHILYASRLARNAGLKNIRFFDADIKETLEYDMPGFDFIVAHGVLSWINEDSRNALIRFIEKKLNPGGIVYVSYNCLPGWADLMPLRALMKKAADNTFGDSSHKVSRSIDFVKEVSQVKSGYFGHNPRVKTKLKEIFSQNNAYLAHEYFNKDWHPFYHADIVSEFETARLSYIGSGDLIDNFLGLSVPKEAAGIITDCRDMKMKETLRDFYSGKMFRKDIFMRGRITLSEKEKTDRLSVMKFGLAIPRKNFNTKKKFPIGEANLQEDLYIPLVDLLHNRPMTLKEISNSEPLRHLSPQKIIEAIAILVSFGEVLPVFDTPDNITGIDRMNRALLNRSPYLDSPNLLVSTVFNSGIRVSIFSQLFLKAVLENKKPAEYAWEILASLGQRINKDGKELKTPEENLKELQTYFTHFREIELPYLIKMGAMGEEQVGYSRTHCTPGQQSGCGTG